MNAPPAVLRQAGVIPYRVVDGKVQVLLITSRRLRQWTIPKGNIPAGSTSVKAAKKEAFEEAGVKGVIHGAAPLGAYTYGKRLASGTVPAVVQVYLMRTVRQARKWREKGKRTLEWISIEQAAVRGAEPGFAPLLDRLLELETALLQDEETVSVSPGG
jgi:8-oxo-dGTP pyrophosphatase MutT (NUDIX family)